MYVLLSYPDSCHPSLQDDLRYSKSTGRPQIMNAATMLKRRQSGVGSKAGVSQLCC